MSFLVFLIFLILKLTHTIFWSWFYVTMPLWAGLAIGCIFSFLGVSFLGLGAGLALFINLFRRK